MAKKKRNKLPFNYFIAIPDEVVTSAQWRHLKGYSKGLLIEIALKYNGKNNGDLSATFTDMQKFGWNSKETLSNALKQLLAAGFLELTRQGGSNQCSLYALTWFPIDDLGRKLDVRFTRTPSYLWKQ